MSIEVVKPGLLTTLQDEGRHGMAHLGIGTAGAFDLPALWIANALCGNPRHACVLELTLLGPTLHFRSHARVALAGAPMSFHIDGRKQPMWAPVHVHAGATVTLGAITKGCRSYLAAQGGFAVAPVLGSCSDDVNAGLGPRNGKPLHAGDVLAFNHANSSTPAKHRAKPTWRLDPRPWFCDDPQAPLRLLPGKHFDAVTTLARAELFSETFTVHNDSNRVGVRLAGPKLELATPIEMVSEGCVPGLLQLPPSGQPIAFGPECPVSGGYPRIGQIAAVDLPRLAQSRPGDALRFAPCTFVEALDALDVRERALTQLEANIAARLDA
ncbi:MAG TPA: biotin-dependent carboxyltransferase family protein [Rhodanobacteraceae bacterium]